MGAVCASNADIYIDYLRARSGTLLAFHSNQASPRKPNTPSSTPYQKTKHTIRCKPPVLPHPPPASIPANAEQAVCGITHLPSPTPLTSGSRWMNRNPNPTDLSSGSLPTSSPLLTNDHLPMYYARAFERQRPDSSELSPIPGLSTARPSAHDHASRRPRILANTAGNGNPTNPRIPR
jgi:hypothetical protein